jgi:hypothetical protein
LRILLGLLVLVTGLSPVFAQTRGPQLFGFRDFEMDWVQGEGSSVYRLRYLAARHMLRIEALDGSAQVMLRDLVKGDILVLLSEGQRGIYGSRGRPVLGAPIEPGDVTRQIAGETCRVARVSGSVLCLADDGIPLAVEDGAAPVRATRLLRQAQNPALFTVPKDAKILPLPGGSRNVPGAPF